MLFLQEKERKWKRIKEGSRTCKKIDADGRRNAIDVSA